ncbi:MAG: FkbM family methyltransferase, partial [Myxococcota bacterium]
MRAAHQEPEQETPDPYRRPSVSRHARWRALAARLVRRAEPTLPVPARFAEWAPLFAELDWLFSRLEDEASRELLVDLVAYQLLPPGRLRLPTDRPVYWRQLTELERMAASQRDVAAPPRGVGRRALLRHDLTALGFPIRVWTRLAAVHTQFVLQSYRSMRGGVDACPGDVVVDAGGCFGDTALLFALKVGDRGRIYSFEFTPANLEIYRENLALNPALAARVEIVERALWSESGIELLRRGDGPSTWVELADSARGGARARAVALDDFVLEKALDRLDLVKMDIEGAEFEALRGAESCLREFRPDLALCVYHQSVDFVRLARAVDALDLGYR